MKLDNADLEKNKRHYPSVSKNEDEFEDIVTDCIGTNGNPKVVSKSMLLQKERDTILFA